MLLIGSLKRTFCVASTERVTELDIVSFVLFDTANCPGFPKGSAITVLRTVGSFKVQGSVCVCVCVWCVCVCVCVSLCVCH